jgi:hypothetical protein
MWWLPKLVKVDIYGYDCRGCQTNALQRRLFRYSRAKGQNTTKCSIQHHRKGFARRTWETPLKKWDVALIRPGWIQKYNDLIAFLSETLVFLGLVKALQGGLRHIMFVQQE